MLSFQRKKKRNSEKNEKGKKRQNSCGTVDKGRVGQSVTLHQREKEFRKSPEKYFLKTKRKFKAKDFKKCK